jgi:hypothetical protein
MSAVAGSDPERGGPEVSTNRYFGQNSSLLSECSSLIPLCEVPVPLQDILQDVCDGTHDG